ncbi:MAG: replicative DNA helicase [Candidatus Ryanbacteria bacterium RIFCSPHIGHO2_12_FULL_47_12b]|uniref:Replicative DNA helicase n=2 Tax=Candidatus Ryaniibacteriota TaxID=1817914 RepID=A0A1G2H5T4_9BACT|nr:MAG: Replicative DNA helicase [Parcubacteria group bacterium GW2011_GWA1_47_9]OGZ45899.1 MAG: replicative DNA helicase [Candidatus Ryanbacteria bacterium RIFCSPHIGHO2_01_FULL_48_80]OGZ47936.1 MAG: replicative DNA helicase [Candidatus Ryanbacteria bacterium RIFCSPHIGHO2_02_FULL_47_25]OGZ51590.1 MAG: replicative DNA helicase [Candidatus Ryanbacteria bacterium RIFCSPHIGHO2_12_FULL_47_12b]OGZ52494.1 MAG: replicative DNA helicase [Candidatus Ryanbacteria bacterium RIFCSPLOWO2_01_FULL_47_79]OGZ56
MADSLKIPPHNKDAEMAVLGSIMIDRGAIARVVDILTPDDFYFSEHALIYNAMVDLFEKNAPLDILSLQGYLGEKGLLERVGNASYLASLVNSVTSPANIVHYATTVNKKRVLRDLISAAHYIGGLGYQEDQDVEVLLDEAEQRVFGVSNSSLRQKFSPVRDALSEAWERIDMLHKGKGTTRGIPTGFEKLDNLLSGLQKSDFVVLAARPSFGKTALALDIARHAAVEKKIPVGIFSLEMSTPQLVDRFIAAEAHVDLWKLRTGRLSEANNDFQRINDALARLAEAPIYIDDAASATVIQMRAMARRLKSESDLGLIIVDYLQLMQPRQHSDSMVQQITEISRSLKHLARELDVPVLALSQLSRAVEQRHPPIPRLSDLRESGAIEQDADVVMFIYREDKAKRETTRPNIAEILVEKHRNGPTGKVELYFNPEKVSFSTLDESFM